MTDAEKGYVFDQAAEGERARLGVIEAYLDPHSQRWLSALGVGAGWRCLDVGGGGGSLTRWLCRQVAPSGSVTAIDLDPRFLEALDEPNLEVRRLDVFSEDFPRDAYDLVHSRYVLEHLDERETALRQLVRAARPGGLISVTDAGGAWPQPLAPSETYDRVMAVFVDVAAAAGWDFGWAPRIAEHMRALGLEDVGAEATRRFETGSHDGVTGIVWGGLTRLRDALVATGRVGADDVDAVRALTLDPKTSFLTFETWSAWGRRPV